MDEKFHSLIESAKGHASAWIETIAERPVRATRSSDELRRLLGGPLAQQALDAETVTATLADAALGGTIASTGPRFFGFVVGGRLPAALAADWLVSTWDQNACVYAQSPLVSVIEQITGSWLLEIAGLSPDMSFGFVTGCQMASFTGLAAARHRVLRRAGWDVEANGLCGAPPIEVVVSEEAHYTIFMALRLLGIGTAHVRRIPTDDQGRMRADELGKYLHAQKDGPCIVCAQAGNVNTGAFDPLEEIAASAKQRGAWLHVDGAFGLWAAASMKRRPLLRGIEKADSIATDGHKWLNVPYDSGIVFCAD
jgi:glutamate/tyrosine decarboxylase-like PLP-dependent enzyme